MLRATWRGILAHKLRLLLSGVAVILGVAFVAGSYVFTDTLDRAFTGLTSGAVGDVIVRADGGSGGPGAGAGGTRTVPDSLVRELAAVPGAARADGRITTFGTYVVGKDGKLVGSNGPPGIAVSYSDGPAANGVSTAALDRGRWPTASGEVLLDANTAARAGYRLGDTVPIVTAGARPRVELTLVGTADFAGTSLVGASIVMLDPRQAQELYLEGADAWSQVWVSAAPGTSQEALKTAVAAALPPGFEAATGDATAARAASRIDEALSFVTTFLLVFAGVALTVGAFLIVNTFSILVAQRSRELALLRAIGASRRQVARTVLVEAGVVGLVGSTLGIGLGILLAIGIRAVFGRVGLDLGSTELVLRPRTVVVALVVGVLVTLVAAYLPARRAGRVPPVAAMRDDAASTEGGLRGRLVTGAVLLVAGVVGMAGGLAGWGSEPTYVLGVGTFGVLVGTALLSPVLGRPVLAVLGLVFRRSFGAVGRMAEQNARRNPRRTGATASALMIGVSLVTLMSVLGASAKASIDKSLAEDVVADYVISSVVGQGFSATVTDAAEKVSGVQEVVRVRAARLDIAGDRELVTGVDPAAVVRVARPVVLTGSLADLGDSGVALSGTYAADHGLAVGSSVEVDFAGDVVKAPVVATYTPDAVLQSDVTMSLAAFDALGVPPTDRTAYVVASPGADRAALRAGLDRAVADLPTVTVADQAQYAAEQRKPIDQLLFIVYALLGLAVVIAVLGIVNTLALSVVERIREIGLLRAVGLSRRQLRTMLRLESVLIAVLGAVLGVVLGLVFAVALQRSLADDGIDVLSIPWLQLAGFVALSGVVGVLAAVWPGRRAARLDVLKAIATQ
ncbi:FtsX-like permease family protein [Nostocoides sp. Soil756]|jgi:putative ABC transport system permease protein|uniref:ABC transporter permease n=1 Tax=Nostocoides sp. Soil756 TaxID=1736399 RepID=UPI0006F39991|nr:FtsX-like permease family protein [Tetrasphaera sp. Soil756]KRE60617.1 ABC transporter permease [Tetrasphaera sp. Soil756]